MRPEIEYQRQFFRLLAEFFERCTGDQRPEAFAHTTNEFDERLPRDATRLAPRHLEASRWFYPAICQFYEENGRRSFGQAKDLGGVKFVIGGSSEFRESHFEGTRKAALYADTILIADPILPWIESQREEEKFRDVLMLRQVFSLLRLRPLVDADLAYPAVFVFQSWEKTLQDNDPQTIEGIQQLTTGVIGAHLGCDLSSFEELLDFASSNPDRFMQGIEKANLFVAPGEAIAGDPISKQLTDYMDHVRHYRSSEHVRFLEQLTPPTLTINGILERMTHQYHLMVNSLELAANPMLCVPQQWHYHELCARAGEIELEKHGLLSEGTIQAVRALNSPKLEWLGEVPIADLVRLREANENEHFRRALDQSIRELHDADLEHLDRVTAQVSHAIASLIAQHKADVKKIQDKYREKHLTTAVSAWVSGAAAFLPILGPFVGAAQPLATLGKYAWDKFGERQELKRASRSMTGIFAHAEQAT